VLRRDHQRRADRRREWRFQLEWTRPGAVWAMDFTPLGGRGSARALCVRDLASQKVLHAAVVGPTAARETYEVVARLFWEHGAPLVLKADNELPFRGDRLLRLLGRHGVLPLYSPRGTPPYNGSCEAGMTGLKRVALDLQIDDPLPEPLGAYLPRSAAILGEQPVTRRAGAPTRDQVWSRRERCTSALREQFRARYAAHEIRYRRARGIAPSVPLSHADQSSIDRQAIRDALCQMNLLVIRKA
jgi:hypothetical protein